MEKEAAARGWELICVDNNSDGATAVKNADDLITMGIDYMIEFNVDQAVAPVIMEKFNAANIPVVAVDIAHPGAVFFGANNERAGTIAGESAGDYINKNWGGEVDYVVLIIQPVSGEAVAPRVKKFPEGLKNKGIEFTDDQIVELDGRNDAQVTQQQFADFLMAHPDAHKIAVATINDVAASGVYAAAETAGRAKDIVLVSQNCTADFVEPMYAVNGDTSWIGSVGFFPNRYGEWVMPIIEKMIAGEPLEEAYYIDHIMIDWSNIKEYYPIDNLPWKGL
jgi:ribose transport system substrate-binding protein